MMGNETKGGRSGWLVVMPRDASKSLMFNVVVEYAFEEDLYAATVEGMGDQIAGSGPDVYAAEDSALRSFVNLVDHSLTDGSWESILASGVQKHELDMEYEEACKFAHEIAKTLAVSAETPTLKPVTKKLPDGASASATRIGPRELEAVC